MRQHVFYAYIGVCAKPTSLIIINRNDAAAVILKCVVASIEVLTEFGNSSVRT